MDQNPTPFMNPKPITHKPDVNLSQYLAPQACPACSPKLDDGYCKKWNYRSVTSHHRNVYNLAQRRHVLLKLRKMVEIQDGLPVRDKWDEILTRLDSFPISAGTLQLIISRTKSQTLLLNPCNTSQVISLDLQPQHACDRMRLPTLKIPIQRFTNWTVNGTVGTSY